MARTEVPAAISKEQFNMAQMNKGPLNPGSLILRPKPTRPLMEVQSDWGKIRCHSCRKKFIRLKWISIGDVDEYLCQPCLEHKGGDDYIRALQSL